MNMHHGHVASCLCCRHLSIEYEGDWSEVTPGMGWHANCLRHQFFVVDLHDQDEMHEFWSRGQTCEKFEVKE